MVGSGVRPDAAARGHLGADRQLLAVAGTDATRPPGRRRRRVQFHRGHSGRRVRRVGAVELGVLSRVRQGARRAHLRPQRGATGRPLTAAAVRDGRRGVGPAGDRGRTRRTGRSPAQLPGGRGVRSVDVVLRRGRHRPPGPQPARRRRRAWRPVRRAGRARPVRRVHPRSQRPAPVAGRGPARRAVRAPRGGRHLQRGVPLECRARPGAAVA